MMSVPTKQLTPGELMEAVLIKGDLARLLPEERTQYYMEVCKSVGLNPLTRPFDYITLNGKLQLYAKKDCTDQLRKLYDISLQLVSQDVKNDVLSVHARATIPAQGRTDEDIGAVSFPDTLKGDGRANAIMRGVTKAKRRVTLSICGLGVLDEIEVEDETGSRRPAPPAPNVMRSPSHSLEATAESPPPDEQPRLNPNPAAADDPAGAPENPATQVAQNPGAPVGDMPLEDMAREAALRGVPVFNTFYKTLDPQQQKALLPLQGELRQLMKKGPPDAT